MFSYSNYYTDMQKILVPISILLAGVFIAGAIVYTNTGTSQIPTGDNTATFGEIRDIQADDHLRGSSDAEITIYEFSDPECPYCKIYHESLLQVTEAYDANTVAWVYRHFPIPQLHPKAQKESEALECAAAQGNNDTFWEYTDAVYATTEANNTLDIGVYNAPSPTPTDAEGNPYYTEKTPRSQTDAGQLSDIAASLSLDVEQFEKCLADGTYAERVNTDYSEAVSAGANGTPTSIARSKDKLSGEAQADMATLKQKYGFELIDEYTVLIPGAMEFDAMKELIDTMRL